MFYNHLMAYDPDDTGEAGKEIGRKRCGHGRSAQSENRIPRSCSEKQKLSINQGGTATRSPLRIDSLLE